MSTLSGSSSSGPGGGGGSRGSSLSSRGSGIHHHGHAPLTPDSSSSGPVGGGSRCSSLSSRGSGVGHHHQGHAPLTLTPRQLLKRATLPLAAHLIAPIQPPGIDLKSPLLLYDTYTSQKVRAVSLRQGIDGSLTPVGPSILIPEAYTGWFSVLSSDGQTAPFFTSIQQIAESKKSFFLTRHDVNGYTLTRDESGETVYSKTVVSSGQTLKLVGVFEDVSNRSKVVKYAQCLNYKNDVVFLPYNVTGRFYSTADKNTRSLDHVYLMAQILKNHKLPVKVKLVCGYMPTVPDSFTGLLKLEKLEKEDVILACTMNYEANATLFEIDATSNFSFAPVADPMLSKQPIFLKTVSYCEDEVETWRRQIKVTHNSGDKRSRSLTRSFSDKFIEPSPSQSTRPLSLSFFKDHLRVSSQSNQEASVSKEKKSSNTPDKSRFRFRDIGVENKTHVKVTERTFSYKSYLIKDKSDDNAKKKGTRKVTKQNTYIFQNGKPETKKVVEEKPKYSRSVSVESGEYSRVADDISLIPEYLEEESHYSEIGRMTINNRGVDNVQLETNKDIQLENNVKNTIGSSEYTPNIPIIKSGINLKSSRGSNFSRAGSMKRINKMSLVNPESDKLNQNVRKSSSLNYTSEKVIVHSSNSTLESPPIEHLYDIPPTEREELDILKELHLEKEKNKAKKNKASENKFEGQIANNSFSRKSDKFESDCLEILNKDLENSSKKFNKDCLEVLDKIMEDKKQKKNSLKIQEEKVVISVESDYPRMKLRSDMKKSDDRVCIQIKPESVVSRSTTQVPINTPEKENLQQNRDMYVVRISVGDSEPKKQSTLRKRESGNGFFMKVKGFEVPDSEVCATTWDKELNGYVSMC